jgi:hypothetical protein
VASKPSAAKQSGITPAKLALIGVLGLVLIAVLYIQFGGSNEVVPPVAAKPAARTRPEAGRNSTREELEQPDGAQLLETNHIANLDRWQPPKLQTVIQHDPFALPASFPQPQQVAGAEAALANLGDPVGDNAAVAAELLETKLEQSRAELEALRQLGVQVVIQQADGYVAMIGDRTIHVGDEINGFTVVAIDSEGVRVARDLKP